VEKSTNSSEKLENQSADPVQNLVQMLYKKREAMPLNAELDEEDVNLNE